MAYEIPDFQVGVWPADIDMSVESTYQYTGVSVYSAVSTTGYGVGGAAIVPPGSTSSPIIGVLQNNPMQGEAGSLTLQGITKAQLGGTVGIGNLLMCQSNGTFVVATSTNYAVAIALEGGASGEVIAILLQRNGKV